MPTAPPTHPRHREGEPFVCRRCNGPCRRWKGSRHGWTCDRCLRRYLDRQVRKLDRPRSPESPHSAEPERA